MLRTMQIIKITELVYSEPKPKTPEEGRAKHDAILAGLNAPVYLGTCGGLTYDQKTDRYAASFAPGDGKKLVLKTGAQVAGFLAAHVTAPGYWLGRMEAGRAGGRVPELVDVYLIQA